MTELRRLMSSRYSVIDENAGMIDPALGARTSVVKVASVVSGSPADKAGLQAGDVITAIDGKQIATADDLTALVNSYKPGDKAALTVDRNGSTKSISVTFGTRPS